MTGPEHYREAERLATSAESILERATANCYDDAQRQASALGAIAQVHATLALAAAQPRSITDDDTVRCAHGAVICGLCGYGVPAGDGGRS